jgi:hypothetical protein
VRWVGDDSHFFYRQKLLGENRSVRLGVVMVKQPGLFSPKFVATSSHVFTQSPQNVAAEQGIQSLAYWDRCFALPQLLYRWRHQFRLFWMPHRSTALPFPFVTPKVRYSSSGSYSVRTSVVVSYSSLYRVSSSVSPFSTSPVKIL